MTDAMKIEFRWTERERPIVLTEHQVKELEAHAGRSVVADLLTYSEQWFAVRTLGQLMRELKRVL
jgi:hypothetical protein